MKTQIIKNRKAFFEYEILSEFVSGIQLIGCEVKSIRQGRIDLSSSFVFEEKGELFFKDLLVHPQGNGFFSTDPHRLKKLLLKKKEITKISEMIKTKGLTCIPLEIFWMKNLIKVRIGICRGKKFWDKRDSLKEKSVKRDLEREQNY